MRKFKLFVLLTLAGGFFMTMSCKKGDTGATGPAGPDSVMYSPWITLQTSQVAIESAGDTLFAETINAPSITATVQSNSLIMAYVKVPDLEGSGDSSIVEAAADGITPLYNVGSIDVVAEPTDATGTPFRYVILPGKVTITDANTGVEHTYTSNELKKMDYTTVTGILKIPANGSSR